MDYEKKMELHDTYNKHEWVLQHPNNFYICKTCYKIKNAPYKIPITELSFKALYLTKQKKEFAVNLKDKVVKKFKELPLENKLIFINNLDFYYKTRFFNFFNDMEINIIKEKIINKELKEFFTIAVLMKQKNLSYKNNKVKTYFFIIENRKTISYTEKINGLIVSIIEYEYEIKNNDIIFNRENIILKK